MVVFDKEYVIIFLDIVDTREVCEVMVYVYRSS